MAPSVAELLLASLIVLIFLLLLRHRHIQTSPSQEDNTNGAKSQVSVNPGGERTSVYAVCHVNSTSCAAPGAALCCFTHAFATGAASVLIQSELQGPTLLYLPAAFVVPNILSLPTVQILCCF